MTQRPPAANEVYRMPPRLFDARCKACWFLGGVLVLVVASFVSLDLQWAQFFSAKSMQRMGRFLGELLAPQWDARSSWGARTLAPVALLRTLASLTRRACESAARYDVRDRSCT